MPGVLYDGSMVCQPLEVQISDDPFGIIADAPSSGICTALEAHIPLSQRTSPSTTLSTVPSDCPSREDHPAETPANWRRSYILLMP
jgi:hypothetical protein